jgi:mannose/cellobiose epimerase-like protein (N-acyl-D-glucosamine 2-epimerase family)
LARGLQREFQTAGRAVPDRGHRNKGTGMGSTALERRAREAESWMMDACFPLWAGQGLSSDGAFLESLDLKHRPIPEELGRVRVQGRQTYVFSVAMRMGWQPERARELVLQGLEVLQTRCRRPDGLFGKRISVEGGLSDDTADLYDTAFAVFACAHACAALDGAEAERASDLARQTLSAVQSQLADPHGGFAEALPRPPFRLQNPHMHLFEACLALYDHAAEAGALELANGLRSLFDTKLYDPATGTLGECFAADWLRLSGDKDDVVEPGHHFEWVWLLNAHARATGEALPDAAGGLYHFALSTLDGTGHPCMSVRRSGAPVDTSRRSWVQTEALKAHLTMIRAGDTGAVAHAVTAFDQLFDEHLTREGGWIDHLEADGTPRGEKMPASTGYHVILALVELIRTVNAIADS